MKIFKFLLSMVVVALLSACEEKTPVSSPGDVAVQLFEALSSGDVQFVKEHLSFSDSERHKVFSQYLDIAASSQQFQEKSMQSKAAFSVAEETIDDDVATVILAGKGPLGQRLRITVRLHKKDGNWKVDGDHGVWHSR